MTPEQIAALLGTALSIALQLPGLSTVWDTLDSGCKRGVLLIAALFIGLGSLMLTCTASPAFASCVGEGWQSAFNAALIAGGASQSLYTVVGLVKSFIKK